MAISPTTVPRVLNTPWTKPNMTTISQTLEFLNSALRLGMKSSFFCPADGVGGVGGLSLKKKRMRKATTVPMIAWQRRELKISVCAWALFRGLVSES